MADSSSEPRPEPTMGDGWPVPCPHEGHEEACSDCWASHQDATPYCDSDEYRRLKADIQTETLHPVS